MGLCTGRKAVTLGTKPLIRKCVQLLDLQGCKLGMGGKGFYPAVMHLSLASLIEKTISITPETAWYILTVYSFSVNSTHIKNCLLLYTRKFVGLIVIQI